MNTEAMRNIFTKGMSCPRNLCIGFAWQGFGSRGASVRSC